MTTEREHIVREAPVAWAKELERLQLVSAEIDNPYLSEAVDALAWSLARASPIAVPPEREGWQPIETAPKDGTRILLWWRTCPYPAVGRWSYDEDFETRRKGWSCPAEGWQCEDDSIIPKNQHDVTHWMPLPSAPETET